MENIVLLHDHYAYFTNYKYATHTFDRGFSDDILHEMMTRYLRVVNSGEGKEDERYELSRIIRCV